MLLLIAATVGAVIGGGLVYAMTHPSPRPQPPAPFAPAPTSPAPIDSDPLEVASADSLRRDALASCAAKQWGDCLAGLDRASDMDPAGDTPAIKAARARAIREIMKPNK